MLPGSCSPSPAPQMMASVPVHTPGAWPQPDCGASGAGRHGLVVGLYAALSFQHPWFLNPTMTRPSLPVHTMPWNSRPPSGEGGSAFHFPSGVATGAVVFVVVVVLLPVVVVLDGGPSRPRVVVVVLGFGPGARRRAATNVPSSSPLAVVLVAPATSATAP